MATRTQVADYVASKLADGRTEAVQAAAAWLVATRRQRQTAYVTRDVAKALTSQGYLFARLTTARPLSAASREAVKAFLRAETGATELELETVVDGGVVGGIRLETPTAELDGTVRRQLTRLVEGVPV